MTRPHLRRDQSGYGDRDRVYDTNHDCDHCSDPDVSLISTEIVTPVMRRNKHINSLICQLFHTEHYRNRTDPKKINFRYWLAIKLIGALDRAELQYFIERIAFQHELLSLESLLIQLRESINSVLEMVSRGKDRLTKEKADC